MKLLTNNELISFWDQFICDGNLESLSKIYFHYYDQLFDYGMRITPDKHAVEDAIQTGFMNFIKGRKNLGKVKNLPGYLISTFRRQLLSELKKQKQLVPSESVPEEEFDFF